MSLPVEQTWLILVNLLTDLKKRNVNVPVSINKNISLLKTSINFYKRDTAHPDMLKEFDRVNIVISEVQSKLLDYASELGDEYCELWIDKLRRANLGQIVYPTSDSSSKFKSNAPPGFSTAKIHLKKPISEDRVQEIAEYHNLILEFEDDVTIALYGDSDNVKKGLQELSSFFKE
ncbi:DUF2096 domain-containing protein [Methanobrevibacter filiformis]|uniref:DUF2096 domain-containing protein n=1 Tax=Methanobrevibacter filiformis TaxID=55758 RepID=A0A162FE97_9EURY|nr:DUF2096 domain-containing protein [Methanobrevibacter filiformis]KZX11755.1 hypothetical protein MBFIL_13170 [Methanobrevibacter filiformis]